MLGLLKTFIAFFFYIYNAVSVKFDQTHTILLGLNIHNGTKFFLLQKISATEGTEHN